RVQGPGRGEGREVGRHLRGTAPGDGPAQRGDGQGEDEDDRDEPEAEHGARATVLPEPPPRRPAGPAPPHLAGPAGHGPTPGSTHALADARARRLAVPGTPPATGRLTRTSTHPPASSTTTSASGPARSRATAWTTDAGSPIAAARAAARAASAQRTWPRTAAPRVVHTSRTTTTAGRRSASSAVTEPR